MEDDIGSVPHSRQYNISVNLYVALSASLYSISLLSLLLPSSDSGKYDKRMTVHTTQMCVCVCVCLNFPAVDEGNNKKDQRRRFAQVTGLLSRCCCIQMNISYSHSCALVSL